MAAPQPITEATLISLAEGKVKTLLGTREGQNALFGVAEECLRKVFNRPGGIPNLHGEAGRVYFMDRVEEFCQALSRKFPRITIDYNVQDRVPESGPAINVTNLGVIWEKPNEAFQGPDLGLDRWTISLNKNVCQMPNPE